MFSPVLKFYFYVSLILLLIIGYHYMLWQFSNYRKTTGYSFLKVHVCLFTERLPPFLKQFLKKYLGYYGEYSIYKKLEKIAGYGKILVNLYIPQGETVTDTEIDILYIHKSGIYIIESKDYSGWIYGNENDTHWTQAFSRRYKYKFYNPILQNYSHVKSLEKLIPEHKNYIIPMVIFSNKSTIKNLYCPKNIVIKIGDIKHEIINHSQNSISEENIDLIYNYLLKYQKHSIEQEEKHDTEIQYLKHS